MAFTNHKTNLKVYNRWRKQYNKEWRVRCKSCKVKKSFQCDYCQLEKNEANYKKIVELRLNK